MIKRTLSTLLVSATLSLPLSLPAVADLEPEPIGRIETLPAQYPDHWMMVHDVSFFHMFEGEVLVVDPLATTMGEQYKGMLTASFIASYEQSAKRNEHYVAETFYSRGSRGGERTDVVTIWDKETLKVSGEIIVPPKRISGMPKDITTAMTPDERFMLIYNFTPGQSISVVDMEKRVFVEEVSTPGCGFVLPNGKRSFTSICSNGTLLTTHLDRNGKATGSEKSAVVIDANDDPVFEGAAMSGGVAYFPTFQGRILPIDMSGKNIEPQDTWWLTDESERNWRPGGMKPYATDSEGLGYFLMNPEGGEGTHKDGGAEVWVYNLAEQKRLGRIKLQSWGLALGSSGSGDGRLLSVLNPDMQLEIYRIPDGEFVHTLSIAPQTPFMVYGAQ